MPLLDLSLVTTTLLRLLKARVDPAWASFSPPSVVSYSGLPSDRLTGDQTLAVSMYHTVEDAYFKNQPPVYQDLPPVRFTPMGIQLHYQLCAHAAEGADAEGAVLRAQRLFGLALKTFHDYPSLNRDTQIGGVAVFPTELNDTDNVFRITLKNIAPNEAISFWTGTQAVRLAAYYEVDVVLLEPDHPQLRASRVLRYGVDVFVNGAPRLDASRSRVTFRLPNETADRIADLQPGESAVGENISFDGANLSGDAMTLLIGKANWGEAEEVGSDWGVAGGTDTVVARVQSRAGAQDVVPGVYSAAARVTRNRRMPDGTLRAFPQASNGVPFTVAPTIANPAYNAIAAAGGPQQIVTVDGGVFQHPAVLPENVNVIVGSEPVPLETSGALTAGHFEIVNPGRIRLRFPISGLNSGDVLPLRVIVNGAENAPRWVQVP
jgi:Pvc16 N-terminal domain